MARIVRFHQTGGPEMLKIEQVDVPDSLWPVPAGSPAAATLAASENGHYVACAHSLQLRRNT
jgi:hypothetical protein